MQISKPGAYQHEIGIGREGIILQPKNPLKLLRESPAYTPGIRVIKKVMCKEVSRESFTTRQSFHDPQKLFALNAKVKGMIEQSSSTIKCRMGAAFGSFPQFVHNYFYPIFAIRLKNPV